MYEIESAIQDVSLYLADQGVDVKPFIEVRNLSSVFPGYEAIFIPTITPRSPKKYEIKTLASIEHEYRYGIKLSDKTLNEITDRSINRSNSVVKEIVRTLDINHPSCTIIIDEQYLQEAEYTDLRKLLVHDSFHSAQEEKGIFEISFAYEGPAYFVEDEFAKTRKQRGRIIELQKSLNSDDILGNCTDAVAVFGYDYVKENELTAQELLEKTKMEKLDADIKEKLESFWQEQVIKLDWRNVSEDTIKKYSLLYTPEELIKTKSKRDLLELYRNRFGDNYAIELEIYDITEMFEDFSILKTRILNLK